MACTKPIRGIRHADGVVRLLKGVPDARLFGTGANPELELPCGRCMDCKLRRSSDWATRATHEASLHDDNSYLTLTFSDEGLALRELQHGTHPYSVDIQDWQRFAKRLRKELAKTNTKLRFFQVGEYGEDGLRPHYHALIFGHAFRGEGETWTDEKGHPKWRSATVEKCWPYGFAEIGELTPETTAYVCRYVTKKLYGQQLKALTERVDSETGEVVTVSPEIASMSRGGRTGKGIGHGWWARYKDDCFPSDFLTNATGKKIPVPRYYANQLKREDESKWNEISEKRKESAAKRAADNTPERRQVRAKVTDGRIALARRRKL